MKLLTYILSALAGCQIASVSAGPPSEPPTPDTYVWVQYADGTERFFKYGECYPYEINGSLAEVAVWLQSASCYNYQGPDCTGLIFPPAPVPVPKGTPLVNVADFVQVIGQGAICEKNDLPGV